MKKLAVLAAILLPLIASAQYRTPSYSDLNDSDMVRAMKEDVSYLASAALEGRAAGSEGELEAARYMSRRLQETGADLLYAGTDGDLFGMRRENGDTLRSHNVAAFIPGSDSKLKDKYVVIHARLDNLAPLTYTVDGEPVTKVFYGANGNASGLAMLLQLAERLVTNRVLLGRSVILAAFGASVPECAGSWYFLNRSFADAGNIEAAVELEMLGTGSSGFYAFTASNADMNAIATSLAGTLQPVHPKVVAPEPCPADHRMFYDRKIPSVMFTTGMYPEYNTDRDTPSVLEYDWMEREVEYIYNYVVELAGRPAPEFNPSDSVKEQYLADNAGVVPYYECDAKPTFLGSPDPAVFLQKWVYVYLRYPREAIANGIQGRVLVDFIIDEKGRVTSVRAVRSSHPLLEEEALRVIKASPDWKPGRVNGRKVKAQMSLNVEFRLEKKK
ncbi:MAG: TonB family protein [Bacteroidales bacterium]|nr:TonB family protein [Bacteroidales bacterium]